MRILLVIAFLSFGAAAQPIPELMREGEVPGLVVVRIANAKIAWHRAYGVANVETRQPLRHAAIFESASLAKLVFAFAVLQLAERGVLSLDEPLSKHIALDASARATLPATAYASRTTKSRWS